ncbi:hypothetical protein [Allosalinactinospora lopnorensis]|uniref:hypothetical protein n=1 Tax=Allosalinactinospora lopnorensis TaxID=1352348 RepID=UPI000623BC47|nr:hypothetical protein [Allosalinactinospora lopnorensis]
MPQNPKDQDNEEQNDPAGSTMMFRKFVDTNDEPAAPPKPPITPYILAAVGVIVAVAIVVAVVMTWS